MDQKGLDTDYSGRPVRPISELVDDSKDRDIEEIVDRFVVMEDGTELADFGNVWYPVSSDGRIDFEHPIQPGE